MFLTPLSSLLPAGCRLVLEIGGRNRGKGGHTAPAGFFGPEIEHMFDASLKEAEPSA